MAESPARNTGEPAKGWSPGPAVSHRRLVALRARYRSSGIRTISRSPSTSPWVSFLRRVLGSSPAKPVRGLTVGAEAYNPLNRGNTAREVGLEPGSGP